MILNYWKQWVDMTYSKDQISSKDKKIWHGLQFHLTPFFVWQWSLAWLVVVVVVPFKGDMWKPWRIFDKREASEHTLRSATLEEQELQVR